MRNTARISALNRLIYDSICGGAGFYPPLLFHSKSAVTSSMPRGSTAKSAVTSSLSRDPDGKSPVTSSMPRGPSRKALLPRVCREVPREKRCHLEHAERSHEKSAVTPSMPRGPTKKALSPRACREVPRLRAPKHGLLVHSIGAGFHARLYNSSC